MEKKAPGGTASSNQGTMSITVLLQYKQAQTIKKHR